MQYAFTFVFLDYFQKEKLLYTNKYDIIIHVQNGKYQRIERYNFLPQRQPTHQPTRNAIPFIYKNETHTSNLCSLFIKLITHITLTTMTYRTATELEPRAWTRNQPTASQRISGT